MCQENIFSILPQSWEMFYGDVQVSPEVGQLVTNVWRECLGAFEKYISVPLQQLRLKQVEQAEAVLLQIKQMLKMTPVAESEVQSLSDEFYSLIPHRLQRKVAIKNLKTCTRKSNLCQLIRGNIS